MLGNGVVQHPVSQVINDIVTKWNMTNHVALLAEGIGSHVAP